MAASPDAERTLLASDPSGVERIFPLDEPAPSCRWINGPTSASGRSRTCTATAEVLQTLGLARAQPTRVCSARSGSRTHRRSRRFELRRFAGLRTRAKSSRSGNRTHLTRLMRACHAASVPLDRSVRRRGIEPRHPGWQPDRLPLHHSRISSAGRRGRTSIAWFRARRPTISRSPNH